MDVNFRCRRCGRGLWVDDFEAASETVCGSCQEAHSVVPAEAMSEEQSLAACWVCGCDQLYRQRDFNRKIGVGIVVVASLFSVVTKGLSLLAAAIIDFFLYSKLSEIVLCYHCEAIHRGFKVSDAVIGYDLAMHERYEDDEWGKRAG